MYVTSVRVQAASVLRRQIDNAHDKGIGTVAQWVTAYAMLGDHISRMDPEELELFRQIHK